MNEYGKCLGCYEDYSQDYYHPKCAKKVFDRETMPTLGTSVEEVERAALSFLSQRLSVTGVQRKLSLKLDSGPAGRMTILSVMGGEYIMKPPSPDYAEMPEIEDLTMHLAGICRIKTARHGLVPMQGGGLAYVTKRFDRENGHSLSVEDMCQLSGLLTEQKYRSSHERIGKIIQKHSTRPGEDALRFFELVLHSFLTGNNDMHLKNFSLMTEGTVCLTPAYDLLAVRLLIDAKDDPEELALYLNGKKSRINRSDFESFGKGMGIPQKVIERTFAAFEGYLPTMKKFIQKSFVSEKHKRELTELLDSRMKAIRKHAR